MQSSIHVACVGGGQLGRMMALEAPRLNIVMSFLDAGGPDCPAGQVVPSNRVVTGSLKDGDAIQQLALGQEQKKADIVTVEIEHINVEALERLEKEHGCKVLPSSRVMGIIQDKYRQKQYFRDQKGIPVPDFHATPTVAAIQEAAARLGLPLMLKSRRGGYDGRGNAVLRSIEPTDIDQALRKFGIVAPGPGGSSGAADATNSPTEWDLYAEAIVNFDHEVAVMVVRSSVQDSKGKSDTTNLLDPELYTTRSYPAVNAIQEDSICRIVVAPARAIPPSIRKEAEQLAVRAIDALGEGACGVFGVEMFVVAQQQSSNSTDPNSNNDGNTPRVLLNEIAPRPHNTGHYTQDSCLVNQFENHLRGICGLPLGKTTMTVSSAAMVNILGAATSMEDTVKTVQTATGMSQASVHWYGKGYRPGRKMGHVNLIAPNDTDIIAMDASLHRLLTLEAIPISIIPTHVLGNKEAALVGVIMGSQSDLPTMDAAIQILQQFEIPYEVDIVSAHRTPDKLMTYSRTAAARGIRVIIAGAGGAAHLPGMVAAMTPLPVVGVPVKTSTLSGVDSLYSIVQMPRGVPVATVAIGNATNAGLLAARILSTSRPNLLEKMMDYQNKMKETVEGMSEQLQSQGSVEFLQRMENKNQSVNV